MPFPYFFEKALTGSEEFILNEETSRHICQVLRMKENDRINITNGKGYTILSEIVLADKKKVKVKSIQEYRHPEPSPKTAIGISLIKNSNRFEWFVEKATEIGISSIIPLICQRTEKAHLKTDRLKSILISAMLQSQQSWLPELREPLKISKVFEKEAFGQKFIAHCLEGEKIHLQNIVNNNDSKIILIGPEGDFTGQEIQAAIQNDYLPVSLGETRLRTETAGIVAAVLLK